MEKAIKVWEDVKKLKVLPANGSDAGKTTDVFIKSCEDGTHEMIPTLVGHMASLT